MYWRELQPGEKYTQNVGNGLLFIVYSNPEDFTGKVGQTEILGNTGKYVINNTVNARLEIQNPKDYTQTLYYFTSYPIIDKTCDAIDFVIDPEPTYAYKIGDSDDANIKIKNNMKLCFYLVFADREGSNSTSPFFLLFFFFLCLVNIRGDFLCEGCLGSATALLSN